MRGLWVLCLPILFIPPAYCADGATAPDETRVEAEVSRPVYIRRYGIRVRADRTELASTVARLTESVFGGIEQHCKIPIASDGEHRLEILVAERSGLSGRNLFFQEGDREHRGEQRLLIRDVAITEHESFMEGCAWLALNRAIRHRQDPGAGPLTVHAPDWLAVGIAQDSEPPLRMRNGSVMREVVHAGKVPTLEKIMAWTHMPRGRWAEKAICGRLVRWLFSEAHYEKRLDKLLSKAGSEGRITVDDIAMFKGLESGGAAEAAWKNWALAEDHRIRQPGLLVLADLETFRRLLEVLPDGVGAESDNPPPRQMTMADMVQHLERDWLSLLAEKKKQELQFFAIGRGQALIDVAAVYAQALELMADRADKQKIRETLRRADQELLVLEKATRARTAYFDQAERAIDSVSRDLNMQLYAPNGSLERSPYQRYIDDFERRF